MAKQTRFYRKWKDSTFNAGGTETIDLPIGLDVEALHFYLYGTVTNSVAWATAKSEGLANLIKRVEVLLNGETIATLPGTMLTHGNFARHGGIIKQNAGTAVGVYSVEVVGFLDFAHIGGLKAKDSNLRTLGARAFQVRITWGVLADMFTGAGASTAALNLTTSVRETREGGDELGHSQEPEVRRLYRFVEKTYPTGTIDRIPLDPNVMYRGLMLRAESGGEVSAAVINNVRVQVGSDIIFDLPASVITDVNIQDNAWAMPGGYLFVDFAPAPSGQSKVGDFLDLYGKMDAFLILDVAGGASNKVQILAHEFEWIEKAIHNNAAHHDAIMEGHGTGNGHGHGARSH